jgi:prepilin-type N-terminal cleavage/methylation domain-containing protein/prepilin-type processing-associated H-X9-DG protein
MTTPTRPSRRASRSTRTSRSSRVRRHRAFTLIELLTVIAIIGILAGILIPVTGKVRDKARDAQCKTALRSWGVAIHLYLNDNCDRLPGPLDQSVVEQIVDGSKYVNKTAKPLMLHLAPYLALPNTGEFQLPVPYICGAFVAKSPMAGGPPYFCPPAQNKTAPYAMDVFPYGKGSDGTQPMLASQLDSVILRIREGIALQDMDYGRLDSAGKTLWGDKVPRKLTHGGHRNTLFWDWHIASRTYAEIP